MSIASELTRIQNLRNALRTKLVSLLGISSSADLEDCVTAVQGITGRGAVSKTLDATSGNQSYTVPDGYHNGSGSVNIVLEEKTGANKITANGTYTPTAGKVFSTIVVDVDDAPVLQEKTATPTESSQNITPDAGYDGLSKVVVNAIPSNYKDASSVTAVAGEVLGTKIVIGVDGEGNKVQITGTMPNNGACAGTIDGLTTESYSLSAGYWSGGTVSLTSDIENALAAI